MKKSKPTKPTEFLSIFPSMDLTTAIDDKMIRFYVRPEFALVRWNGEKGKVFSLAVLGDSTVSKVRVLASRDFVTLVLEKLITAQKQTKGRKVVVTLPTVILTGLKSALKNGTADIVLPADLFNAVGAIPDASVKMMAATMGNAIGGKDIRISLTVGEDVVLDVRTDGMKSVRSAATSKTLN